MTAPPPSRLTSELTPHSDAIRLLSHEADRRLVDVNRRLEILASRGSFVVGAAAVASGVQLTQGLDLGLVLSTCCALIAVGLSLPLLRFKRGQEVNVVALVRQLVDRSAIELELELINAKMKLVKDGERWARGRSRLLLASLVALGLSIASNAARITINW